MFVVFVSRIIPTLPGLILPRSLYPLVSDQEEAHIACLGPGRRGRNGGGLGSFVRRNLGSESLPWVRDQTERHTGTGVQGERSGDSDLSWPPRDTRTE